MLSLVLAVLYSGVLSLLVQAPCAEEIAAVTRVHVVDADARAEPPLARSPAAALRFRMTLPYVPQSQPRTREQQEI